MSMEKNDHPLIQVTFRHDRTLADSQFNNKWKFIKGIVEESVTSNGDTPFGLFIGNEFVVSGDMPKLPKKGQKSREPLYISAIIERDPSDKMGDRYRSIASGRTWSIQDIDDERVVTQKLLSIGCRPSAAEIVAENISASMIGQYLAEGETKPFTSLTGVGRQTVDTMQSSYDVSNTKLLEAVETLHPYGFDFNDVKRIVKHYKNPNRVTQVAKNDFYNFARVPGLTFGAVDEKYLTVGEPLDDVRIHALTAHIFAETSNLGSSWLTSRQVPNAFDTLFHPMDPARNTVVDGIVSGEFEQIEHINDDGRIKITHADIAEIEYSIAYHLNRLKRAPSIQLRYLDEATREMNERVIHKHGGEGLSFEQQLAANEMADNNTYMLQGYAGTGKTTSMQVITNAMKKQGLTVLAGAYTGRAAKNLADAIDIKATTLHAMLGAEDEETFHTDVIEQADAILVDELSMVPAPLFNAIVSNMKDGARLYCIGDEGQLEPISSIGVMKGIVESDLIPKKTLKVMQRRAQDSANSLWSKDIRDGRIPQELTDGQKNGWNKLYGVEKDLYVTAAQTDDQLIQKATQHGLSFARNFPEESWNVITNVKRIANPVNQRIQTAINPYKFEQDTPVVFEQKYGDIPKGTRGKIEKANDGTTRIKTSLFGSADIHTLDPSVVQPIDDRGLIYRAGSGLLTIHSGDRVMNTQNNYAFDPPVYNGTLGEVVDVLTDEFDDLEGIIVTWDGRDDQIFMEPEHCGSMELGYACTIHKMQGSTVDNVALAFATAGNFNSRELLYTGMTRVAKRQSLISGYQTITDATANKTMDKRQTLLGYYAQKISEKKQMSTFSDALGELDNLSRGEGLG